MRFSQNNKYLVLIWVWMALSSIVLVEPAPYDVLFILCLVIACLFSYLSFYEYILLPQLLLGLYVNTNLISLILVTRDINRSIDFVLITIYLAASWFFLTGLLQHYRQVVLRVIFSGYIVAALIAAVMGIVSYFGLIPQAEGFLYYGRAMGFFKDANVYGPFIIPMVLYALYQFEMKQNGHQFLWILILAILSSGVLLSFSRAAWANYLISVFLYFVLPPWPSIMVRVRKMIFVLTLLILILVFALCQSKVSDLFSTRLEFKEYDNERFGTQIASLRLAIDHPWGVGPGQTEKIFNYSTHSLYVRVLTENGVIGISAFLCFLFLTIVRSLRHSFGQSKNLPYAAVITASLVGVIFNSFFIDTLHWRHLWLLLALPWIPLESGVAYENSTNHNPVR